MGDNAGFEWIQAELEMQQMLSEALDRCAAAGAKEDDLRLLAWQAGMTNWKPNAHAAANSVG